MGTVGVGNTSTGSIGNAGYVSSNAQCLAFGGHCWVEAGYVIDTLPPIYHRACKHCGHRQSGRPQEVIRWEDDEN